MTTYPTPDQQAQQATLAALRAEMYAEQEARADRHNKKQGAVICTCGHTLHKFTK